VIPFKVKIKVDFELENRIAKVFFDNQVKDLVQMIQSLRIK